MRSVNEWALTLRIALPRNTQCFTAIVQTITEIWRYWEYWEFVDYVPDPVRSYYNYVHCTVLLERLHGSAHRGQDESYWYR